MSKSKYKKRDIQTLVILSRSGDTIALEELIHRVQKDICVMFSYLTNKRHDVADLTQDALVRMAKKIQSLKNPSCFKSWLNQIVSNVFYDYVKRNARDNCV